MKRVVVAIVAIASLEATVAVAADLPPAVGSPPVEMLPVKAPGLLQFNWGGPYAGLNLGGGFGGDVTGVVVGGQIGYNWQISQLVFGAETDIQFSAESDTSTFPYGTFALTDKQALDWFGTLRGRAGYVVFDRWLPYATAGLAYGTRKASGTVSGVPSGAYSATDTSIGWVAGAGVDYAINPSWSARLEYLHVSLDSFSPTYALTGGNLTVGYARLNNDIVRAAVNYRFTAW